MRNSCSGSDKDKCVTVDFAWARSLVTITEIDERAPNFGCALRASGASTRSGDYISVRGDGALFGAVGYAIIKINAGAVFGNAGNLLPDCRFDPHYVSYGRSSDVH